MRTHASESAVAHALTQPGWDVVMSPPGDGPGFWAGGPSVATDGTGFALAYRLRRPVGLGRGYANAVASSADGVHFETVGVVPVDRFGSASLERPALVQRADGGWRLYVSASVEGTKQWWVEAIDASPAGGLAELADPAAPRTVVLAVEQDSAWKDVVVRRDGDTWHMWACQHLLDRGEDEADRMQSVYLSSADGLNWTSHGVCLAPTAGSWNSRGTRVTSVWRVGTEWVASYDGRSSAAENWYERTGFAIGTGPDRFVPTDGPFGDAGTALRYLSVAPTDGGWRVYVEATRPDGANELRTFVTSGVVRS